MKRKVEQVVWTLSLIMTLERKAQPILVSKHKNADKKTRDDDGTEVAQNGYPVFPTDIEIGRIYCLTSASHIICPCY
jgi:hypothetical protein